MHLITYKVQGMACHFEISIRQFKIILAIKRLTLIASDPGISAALLILSVSRMILIYLNYRFWLRTWKIIYAKFLDSFILDRDRDVILSLDQGRSDRGSGMV